MKCLQETGPDFVIRNMEDYLTGSKFCDLAFICDDNLVRRTELGICLV